MARRMIRITAKRQATLPAALCEELGVGPGDSLELERTEVDGKPAWVLHAPKPDWSWAGALRDRAKGKSHDWARIERSIEEGLAGERRP